ncbi:MAG: leucine-rich repeat domain-containing protein [Clostridia bacterium]|nr:leucine-rich repeat domain-containing protein [Clostridia bacterium]
MTKMKKLILSVSVLVTMLVALVIGFTIPNDKASNPTTPANNGGAVSNADKPLTYTYNPGEVRVQKGDDIINYQYEPGVNGMEDTATTVAYEYVFGNPMSVAMAVWLKSIDSTDVNVSYVYRTTPLTSTEGVTGATTYTTQTIAVNGSDIYIYILVSPTSDEVPVNFTSSVLWKYGVASSITINNNIGATISPLTIVNGQIMEAPSVTAPSGYYFDAWFLDEDYTQLAEFPMSMTTNKLYARFHNMDEDTGNSYLYYDSSTGSYATCSSSYGLYGELIIPTQWNDGTNGDAPVTGIGSDSFSSTEVVSVDLPYTITTIGNSAFYDMYKFSGNLDLSNCINLETISSNAFFCTNITSIKLPSSLKYIDAGAFQGLNVKELDLSHCTNLETIGIGALSGGAVTSINLSGCTKLTTISEQMFSTSSALVEVKLPSTITTIGSSAFNGCTSLTSIKIPSGVTSIPENAFYGCSALESVDMSTCASMTSIGDSAFRNCVALESITIPASVTSIGANAFDTCNSLTNAIMPTSLTTLRGYAFQNSGLTGINLARTQLTSLSDYIFNGCTAMKYVVLPSALTSIATYTFGGCSSLENVNLGNCTSLTEIKLSAFDGCSKLQDITIPSTVQYIRERAFFDCDTLTRVYIPASVSIVEESAFSGCDNLMSIVVDSNNEIYDSRNNCNAIITISNNQVTQACGGTVLFEGIESIGQRAFSSFNNLTDVVIPSTVTSIGDYAFYECANMTSVVIPTNCTTIGTEAFKGCTNLATVFDLSTSLTITAGSTDNGYVGYYATNIVTNANTLVDGVLYMASDTEFIAVGLADTSLTSIALDSRTTSIAAYAFYNNFNSTKSQVDFSKCVNLTTIGEHAFNSCEYIETIDLSACIRLTRIEDNAFYYITCLESVILPPNLQYIGDYVFACSLVTTVTIPASVTSMGKAFSESWYITTIYIEGETYWNVEGTDMMGGGLPQGYEFDDPEYTAQILIAENYNDITYYRAN